MQRFAFPHVWIGTDLGDFRGCDSTYCRYDLDSLPELPTFLFDGTYSWLRRHCPPLESDKRFADFWGGEQGIANWKADAQRARPELTLAARDAGVVLPDPFITFLFDVGLVTMIRSPTDCYFRLPKGVIANRGESGGHFVHFFSDSQNCYEWYLFVDLHGRNCVVASVENLAGSRLPDQFWENRRQEIVCCAPSFEAFVFRLWIETESWFRLVEEDQPLTDEMYDYLNASRSTKEAES